MQLENEDKLLLQQILRSSLRQLATPTQQQLALPSPEPSPATILPPAAIMPPPAAIMPPPPQPPRDLYTVAEYLKLRPTLKLTPGQTIALGKSATSIMQAPPFRLTPGIDRELINGEMRPVNTYVKQALDAAAMKHTPQTNCSAMLHRA